MGSAYLFGIPLWEDAAAADKRRNDRTDRKRIEENSDVRKKSASEQSEQVRAATGTNVGGAVQGVASSFMEPAASLFGGVGEGFATGNLSLSVPGVGSLSGSPGGSAPSQAPQVDPTLLAVGGLVLVGAFLLMGRK